MLTRAFDTNDLRAVQEVVSLKAQAAGARKELRVLEERMRLLLEELGRLDASIVERSEPLKLKLSAHTKNEDADQVATLWHVLRLEGCSEADIVHVLKNVGDVFDFEKGTPVLLRGELDDAEMWRGRHLHAPIRLLYEQQAKRWLVRLRTNMPADDLASIVILGLDVVLAEGMQAFETKGVFIGLSSIRKIHVVMRELLSPRSRHYLDAALEEMDIMHLL